MQCADFGVSWGVEKVFQVVTCPLSPLWTGRSSGQTCSTATGAGSAPMDLVGTQPGEEPTVGREGGGWIFSNVLFYLIKVGLFFF